MQFNTKLFKQCMKDKGLKQADLMYELSKHGVNIKIDAIKSWTRSNNPSVPEWDTILTLGKIFNIDAISLIKDYDRTPLVNLKKTHVDIPIIEALAGCGSAGLLDQLQISDDKMSIDKRLLPRDIITDKLSMIRIVGDSMMPYLDENDWAIIQMRNGYEVTHVNGVYLITHGENVHIKRCAFQADGSCLLISDNPLYPVETAYAGDWDIVGKVVARLKFGSPMLIKE